MNELNGQLESVITPTSFEYNGMTNIAKILLFEDGCFSSLPEEEWQLGTYFDSYGCASFSFLNALETAINRALELDLYSAENAKWLKDNYSINGKINFNDRDLVVLSDTDPQWGNSTWNVFEASRKKGLICQTDDDWDYKSRDVKYSKENYYKYQRTEKNDKKAKELLKRFEIKGEWASRDNWLEASKYGAIQVYTRAWFKRDNGIYYNPTPNASGHGIMLVHQPTHKLFDQYNPFIKQMERDEDFYPMGFKLNLIEKTMEKPIIKNNTLIQLVSGQGGFGLYLDGKIIIDSLDKILASWLVRTGGNTNGMTKALQQTEWDMFKKVNLKMEEIN